MGLHAGMNPGYLPRQMGHTNAKMFFEVYSKWIDGAANQLERGQDAKPCSAIRTTGNSGQ
jgi:integrase